ncbi:MAG: hypothetical protein II961_01660 [Candidatus Riflebacteria bacterium]|nr:hypothetical protein [Candidatus Riflebacteria bacterium]
MANKVFQELEAKLPKNTNHRVVVPLAANEAVITAIKEALEKKLISGAELIGIKSEIEPLLGSNYDSEKISFIEAESEKEALSIAVNEVKNKKADILMKGMCQSASLIKAVLDKQNGLEHGFMSHLTCFQLPDKENISILTDPAVNIAPDEDTIVKEIDNAADFFKKLSSKAPMVALLAANEKVSDKMPSTKLAEAVTKRFSDRTDLTVEGPVAFDLAVSSKSAQIKKYKGKLNGDADLFIAPRIETANALYKSLQHYIHADMGGLLYGANIPVIHPSRSDNTKTKYYSLLLGLATYL